MNRLGIFASGNGSNVENIFKFIKTKKLHDHNRVDSMVIGMVFINNKNAYVVNRCKLLNIPYLIIDDDFMNNGKLLKVLKEQNIDFIILSGFLKKIPDSIINIYNKKIINIHPSLLPKYGGKGMYGMNVHKEVIKNKENYSGISIHYVNEEYDKGDIIYRVRQRISSNETPESLYNKIKILEYKWYPLIIHSLILKLN